MPLVKTDSETEFLLSQEMLLSNTSGAMSTLKVKMWWFGNLVELIILQVS